MYVPLVLVLSFVLSAAVIRAALPWAHSLDIVDRPGGHKGHGEDTPFIGGLGVITALLAFLCIGLAVGHLDASLSAVMMITALAVFVTGFVDDLKQIGFAIRFSIQILAAAAMVLFAGVSGATLGELLPGLEINFPEPIALAFTVFATVGCINALNMIDGVDGLSGTISLVSLCLTAFVAIVAQQPFYLLVSLSILGGVLGFLVFNLRCCKWSRARVFLGDNGSMLLGFLFAWLFLGLSQGEHPAMTPVTALYLFAMPLFDTVAVMIRRIWMRRLPFHADQHHLHHLLQRAGGRVPDVVFVIAGIHLAMGLLGILGLYAGVPEWAMFWLFIGLFCSYTLALIRPWRFVPVLRQLLLKAGFTLQQCRGVYIGRFAPSQKAQVMALLDQALKGALPFSLFEYQASDESHPSLYVFVDTEDEREARRVLANLRRAKPPGLALNIRQYLTRESGHDRRADVIAVAGERRSTDRRGCGQRTLVTAFEPGDGSTAVMA